MLSALVRVPADGLDLYGLPRFQEVFHRLSLCFEHHAHLSLTLDTHERATVAEVELMCHHCIVYYIVLRHSIRSLALLLTLVTLQVAALAVAVLLVVCVNQVLRPVLTL